MEMEEVVASVFDLMGKTSEPQLEEEFLKARVDNMFHVRLLQILTIIVLQLQIKPFKLKQIKCFFTENGFEWGWFGVNGRIFASHITR